MVLDDEGKVESDPIEVLRIWRRFSAEMADFTPSEEGMYDDEYKKQTESKLENLRKLHLEQPYLDAPITRKEIF